MQDIRKRETKTAAQHTSSVFVKVAKAITTTISFLVKTALVLAFAYISVFGLVMGCVFFASYDAGACRQNVAGEFIAWSLSAFIN